jgi:uncharacterized protein
VPARERELEAILATNPVVATVLERTPALDLPDWYLGAGAVANTVWNHIHGFDPEHGIDDYDLVYFDASDLSDDAEHDVRGRIDMLFADIDGPFHVTNEARVHLWYEEKFGTPIAPYASTADAITTWPTTATSIGVRRTVAGFEVCAPFGLDDLFALVVRPNPKQITEVVYHAKVARWRPLWPQLTIEPWPG